MGSGCNSFDLGVFYVVALVALAWVVDLVLSAGDTFKSDERRLDLRREWTASRPVQCKTCGWQGTGGEWREVWHCPKCGASEEPDGYVDTIRGSDTIQEALLNALVGNRKK